MRRVTGAARDKYGVSVPEYVGTTTMDSTLLGDGVLCVVFVLLWVISLPVGTHCDLVAAAMLATLDKMPDLPL